MALLPQVWRDTVRAMSEENVEIVRRALDRFSETGVPDWDLDDADLVWTTRPDGVAQYTYRGLDGLRERPRRDARGLGAALWLGNPLSRTNWEAPQNRAGRRR